MKIFSDGYTMGGNPSRIGGGFVVMNENFELLAMIEIRQKYFTNNEAELRGVLEASRLAKDGDEIITDSLVSYWWVKKCQVKARQDLFKVALEANQNIKKKHLKFYQLPREQNLAGNYIEFTLKK